MTSIGPSGHKIPQEGPDGGPAQIVPLAATGLLTCIMGSHNKYYLGYVGYDKVRDQWVGWLRNGRNGAVGQVQTPLFSDSLRNVMNHVESKVQAKTSKDYSLHSQSPQSVGPTGGFSGAAENEILAKASNEGFPVQAPPTLSNTPSHSDEENEDQVIDASPPDLSSRSSSELESIIAEAHARGESPASLILDDD